MKWNEFKRHRVSLHFLLTNAKGKLLSLIFKANRHSWVLGIWVSPSGGIFPSCFLFVTIFNLKARYSYSSPWIFFHQHHRPIDVLQLSVGWFHKEWNIRIGFIFTLELFNDRYKEYLEVLKRNYNWRRTGPVESSPLSHLSCNSNSNSMNRILLETLLSVFGVLFNIHLARSLANPST